MLFLPKSCWSRPGQRGVDTEKDVLSYQAVHVYGGCGKPRAGDVVRDVQFKQTIADKAEKENTLIVMYPEGRVVAVDTVLQRPPGSIERV